MSKSSPSKDVAVALATDHFVSFWQRVLSAVVPHLGKIGAFILLALLMSVVAWGWNEVVTSRREKASEMLAQALRIYHAELLGEKDTQPEGEEVPRFRTAKERAEETLRQLDKLTGEYPRSDAARVARLVRAGVLYGEGRYGEAEQAYRTFLESKPNVPALEALAREGLGLCAEAQGKPDVALSIYKEQGGPFYRDRFLFHQARILLGKGQKQEAAKLYGEIAKMAQSALRDEAQNRLLALED
ncbi:MAG: tetratricopeptide repeat protein [Myxococcales bacterium]|nr:tetratricopeptide repeat protein [Myxococcota bacterium]MDW8284139.1 tetratricopeptide repeat protein [Myxococcales bacterium]